MDAVWFMQCLLPEKGQSAIGNSTGFTWSSSAINLPWVLGEAAFTSQHASTRVKHCGGLMPCGLLGWRKSYDLQKYNIHMYNYNYISIFILLFISWNVPDIGSLLADIMVVLNYSILLGKLWNLNIIPLQRKIKNSLQTCIFDFHVSLHVLLIIVPRHLSSTALAMEMAGRWAPVASSFDHHIYQW